MQNCKTKKHYKYRIYCGKDIYGKKYYKCITHTKYDNKIIDFLENVMPFLLFLCFCLIIIYLTF